MKTVKYLIPTLLSLGMLFSCNPASSGNNDPVDTDVHATGVSLNETSKTVTVGDSFTLRATVSPSDATNSNVTWSSSDNDYATVANGVVSALKDGTVTITATTVDGGFTASCAVTINPKTVETSKMYVHDTKELIKEISEKVDGEFSPLTNKLEDDGVTYYNVTLGNEIRVKLENNGYFVPISLNINGDDHSLDNDGYVTFVADKGDYDFISITPNYRDDTPITKEYAFTINDSAHISLKIYSDSGCINEINSANPYETVYVKATSDDEDIYCRDVNYYKLVEGSTPGKNDINQAHYDEAKDIFYFEVPYASEKKIAIYPTEGNNALLKGNKVVGEYLPISISSATRAIESFDTNKTVVVSQNGRIVRFDGDRVNREDQVKTVYDDYLYTESYHNLPYGDKYLFTSDDTMSNFHEPLKSNYDLLCVQKENSSDDNSLYTVDGERFAIDGNFHVVIRTQKENHEYISFYIDYGTKTFYPDVKVEMIYGNKVNDTFNMYKVYDKDDQLLLGVTYVGEGGYSARRELVSPCGAYTNNDSVLVIPNEDTGILDGVSFVATINGNNVTLKNATRQVVVSLDLDKNTFSVVSDEEVVSTFPNLKGLVFSGQFYNGFDEVNEDLRITFNNYESEEDCQAELYYKQNANYTAILSVVYDADTNIITFSIEKQYFYNGAQETNWISTPKHVRARLSEGKMTFLDDFNNIMSTKNATLTCADFHL